MGFSIGTLRDACNVRRNFWGLVAPSDRDTGQLPVLNVVRTVAVALVILFHGWRFLSVHAADPLVPYLETAWFMRLVVNGEFAVDMFFVLSGFLIGHVLWSEYSKTGHLAIGRFYLRRWLRIFPAIAVVLAIYWPATTFLLPGDNSASCNRYGWMNLLFINNFSPAIGGCMQWTWSVACEMQYYALSPFLMLLLLRYPRVGRLAMPALLLASLAVRVGVIVGLDLAHPGFDVGTYMDAVLIKPYTRVGPYLIGMFTACLWRGGALAVCTAPRRRWPLLLGSLLLLAVLVQFGEGQSEPLPQPLFAMYLIGARTLFGLGVAGWIAAVLCADADVDADAAAPRAATGPSSAVAAFGSEQSAAVQSRIEAVPLTSAAAQRDPDDDRDVDEEAMRPVARALPRSAASAFVSRVQRGWACASDWVLRARLWYIGAQLGYSAFLLHPVVIVPLYQVFPPASVQMNFGWFVLTSAIVLLITHVLAAVLYLFVEKPVMNLRT